MRRLVTLLAILAWSAGASADVRVKDLGRFLGWRDNALVGYGIVVGLSGSGDSPSSEVTREAMRNVLSRLGANVPPELMRSRNVAAVLVTATLPAAANLGDRIDITVSSIGDARSLAGGTLLLTPLLGPDQNSYALAQGPLVVGGHRFDADLNLDQRNYPTSGRVPGGATVETAVRSGLVDAAGDLTFILDNPDPETARRIASEVNVRLGVATRVRDASAVLIAAAGARGDPNGLVAAIGELGVTPDGSARVVINERTGTVVAGGNVQISSVVISQGDIRVSVTGERYAAEPFGYGPVYGGYEGYGPSPVSGLIVTNTKLDVSEGRGDAVRRFPASSVADLVQGLSELRVDTRGIIAVLQAIKTAGALHAELVVQ